MEPPRKKFTIKPFKQHTPMPEQTFQVRRGREERDGPAPASSDEEGEDRRTTTTFIQERRITGPACLM